MRENNHCKPMPSKKTRAVGPFTSICTVALQAQLKLSVVQAVTLCNCFLHSLNHT